MKKLICLFIAVFMVIALCACGAEKSEAADDAEPVSGGKPEADGKSDVTGAAPGEPEDPSKNGASLSLDDPSGDAEPAKDLSAAAEKSAALEGGAAYEFAGEGGAAVPDGGVTGDPTVDPGDVDTPDLRADIEAGTLTAGEWKDNDNYDFWQGVLAREDWVKLAELWKMDLSKRFAVTVTDGQNPAKNVAVELTDAEGNVISRAVSDSYGKAYLYYDIRSEGRTPAAILVGGTEKEISAEELEAGGATVGASGERFTKLDLMFTTDTTGSMSDELEYLKEELGNVIERVAEENAALDIRLSVNFYRDEGDDYVVRDFAFSGDIDEVLGQLFMQFSDGGGDYPEAVHTALDNSINDHDWREDAVKLLFLTLDAPGHSETAGVAEEVRDAVVAAASKGVRIIPIAASGVDTETEFMLRAMASATGGTYIFLTDDSGVGEGHLEPTIGDYNVRKLNDLLVKVINEYCK